MTAPAPARTLLQARICSSISSSCRPVVSSSCSSAASSADSRTSAAISFWKVSHSRSSGFLYSTPRAFASFSWSSKKPAGSPASSSSSSSLPFSSASASFLSKKSLGTSVSFVLGSGCMTSSGALDVHSLPVALELAAIEGSTFFAAGFELFFNIDFCGALFRLRKALVLAESKKFSGTPAFLDASFFS